MPKRIITITDADRRVDYELSVSYDRLPREPEVGLGEGIEVNGVRCLAVTTWCGDWGGYTEVALDRQIAVGAWCGRTYKDEIEEALQKETANANVG